MAAFDAVTGLAFLHAHGFGARLKSPKEILRQANKLARLEEAGIKVTNQQALRGHVVTPEHPGRRRPIINATPREYGVKRSGYLRQTRPLEPRLRPAITIKRPPVHSRDITQVEDMIEVPGHALIVTTGQQARAMTALRNHRAGTATFDRARRTRIIKPTAERPGVHWRVRIDIYDCSSRQHVDVFTNQRGGRHSQGIGVDFLLRELTESEMSLEEYLIRVAIESGASGRGLRAPLTHICHYTLIFTPSDANYWMTHT